MRKVILFFVFLLLSISVGAQNDSIGVYADKDGVYKAISPIHYMQIKIGIGRASNVFAGATSVNKFAGQAKFRFYFGNVSAHLIFSVGRVISRQSLHDT